MLKQVLLALLLTPLFFSACKKFESASEFTVDGIHDVELGVAGSVLNLIVRQTSGNELPVALTVPGLPPGITASIQPANIVPGYTASISFFADGAAPGTYPIQIVAASSEYSKTYTLNLINDSFDGFWFGGTDYSTDSTAIEWSMSRITIHSSSNGGATVLVARPQRALPITDGVYTIPISNLSSDMQVWVQAASPVNAPIYRNAASGNGGLF